MPLVKSGITLATAGSTGSNPVGYSSMIPQVQAIGGTEIAWEGFLKACVDTLGYSPIRGVDAIKRELSEPAKFVAALSAFHDKLNANDPIKSIRSAGSLLKHLSYTFMVLADDQLILDIRERTELTLTSASTMVGCRLILISGNLKQFLDATVECCSPDVSIDIRYLFDFIVLHFDRIGLGELWYEYRRKSVKDKTFLLEHKP